MSKIASVWWAWWLALIVGFAVCYVGLGPPSAVKTLHPEDRAIAEYRKAVDEYVACVAARPLQCQREQEKADAAGMKASSALASGLNK